MRYTPDVLPFHLDGGLLAAVIKVAADAQSAVDLPEWTSLTGPAKREAKNKAARRLRPKEQIALYKWARDNGHLLDNQPFSKMWKEGGKRGETENEVYYDESSGLWMKRNDLSYHDTYLSFFHRVAMHNKIFPEAPLCLVGFVLDKNRNTDDQVMLKPVLSQPHVEAERGANQEEVGSMMSSFGYKKVGEHDYFHPEYHIRVEDLHDENVFIRNGELFVIDPVIFLDDSGKETRLKGSIEMATAALAS